MNALECPEALRHKALPSGAQAGSASSRPKPRLASSAEWVANFIANAQKPCGVPWERGAEGIGRNLPVIAQSLRGWQLGESSDGAHLSAMARTHAEREGDPAFFDAMRLFIAEEQRHAAELGRWLDLAGIPRAKRNWGDSCFRAFRHCLPSMEAWTTPVVLIETHALIYYRAIQQATDSPVLQAICARLLADEVPHLRFQSERFARIFQRRNPFWRKVTMGFHHVFFAGITLAVWAGHGAALEAGGLSFRKFWRTAWIRMRHVWRMMDPKRYSWEDGH